MPDGAGPPRRPGLSAASSGRRRALARADRMLAALLLAACVIVPVLFSLSQDDVFALPKGIALLTIGIVAVIPIAVVTAIIGVEALRFPLGADAIWLLAFVVLNAAAWFSSLDVLHSFTGEPFQYQGFLSVLLYAWFLCIARWSIRTPRRLLLLFGAIVTGAVAVAVYAICQWAGLDPIWGDAPDRVYPGRALSTIGQPNALAAYLVLATATAAGLWLGVSSMSRRRGAVLALVICLLLAAHIVTFSRGGAAGLLAAGIVFMSWRRPDRRLVRRLAVGVAGCLILVLALAWEAPSIRGAVASLWGRARFVVQGASLRQHVALWDVAAHIAADHLLLGTGQETYSQVFFQYRDTVLEPAQARLFWGTVPESPHSVYLALAAGAGIPALLAYLGLITCVIRKLRRAIRAVGPGSRRSAMLVALLAAMVGHLVTDAAMTAEVTSTWLFWVLMGAALGVTRNRESASGAREGSAPA
jgi:O-antigen ligase